MQVESKRIELNWLCDRSMCRFVDLSPRLFVDCVGNSSGREQAHALIPALPHATCHMLLQLPTTCAIVERAD